MPRIRWLIIWMCFLANAISYIDRANLAIAAHDIQTELGINAAETHAHTDTDTARQRSLAVAVHPAVGDGEQIAERERAPRERAREDRPAGRPRAGPSGAQGHGLTGSQPSSPRRRSAQRSRLVLVSRKISPEVASSSMRLRSSSRPRRSLLRTVPGGTPSAISSSRPRTRCR